MEENLRALVLGHRPVEAAISTPDYLRGLHGPRQGKKRIRNLKGKNSHGISIYH